MSLLGLIIIAIQLLQFDFFDLFFGFFGLFFIAFFVIFFVVFAIIVYGICKAVRTQRQVYDKVTFPQLSRRERRVIRESLPTECPECDAPLKYNEVKWVGPRRAECPYCGNVVDLEEQEVID